MRPLSLFILLAFITTALATPDPPRPPPGPLGPLHPPPGQRPIPLRWGILGFPKFVGLDAYGPIEMLNIVKALTPGMTLAIVAETMDLIPTHVLGDLGGPITHMKPTHTFSDNAPLDVLLIPGGPGSRVAYNNTVLIDYVKRVYPSLQYILSTCTGAQILAKAGMLDGKRATTAKFSWQEMVKSGPKVKWVSITSLYPSQYLTSPGTVRPLGKGWQHLDELWCIRGY